MDKSNIFQSSFFFSTLQPELSSFMFENENMHKSLRLQLLEIANIFITNTADKLGGLIIRDICLVGSFASYFYHDKSDIDLLVMVDCADNSFLSNNDEAIFGLLNNLSYVYFKQYGLPKCQGKTVDIKLNNLKFNYIGKFSLLTNSWLVKPDKVLDANITQDSLLKGFFTKLGQYSGFMKNIYFQNFCFDLTIFNQVKTFIKNNSINSLDESKDNLNDYLVQKIMLYNHNISDINQQNTYNLCRALSLKTEETNHE